VTDTIKCVCGKCGAKYRLPVEAQGRTARCKRCGDKFQVPKADSLEDSILTWLSGPEEEEIEEAPKPRVISMPNQPGQVEDAAGNEASRRRGPIRMKDAGKGAKSESA
jgi:hypothetical protein